MAKPRVFVSSTYYDLKYVRERLERFISSYCFDPVLFESDEIFFNPNIKLDESCYKEVENCHIMLLIVGGRYGSYATDQKEKYEEQYISITRKEYETARRRGIPVMVFVEQNVFAEYKTYIANKKELPKDFKFAFVDDVRVFEFILTLEQSAIKVFGKVDDIEHYFSHQIAGMLLSYLKQLQDNKSNTEVKTAVDEIKVVSQSMQEMLNSIAEKILHSDQDKYNKLLRKQNESLIDLFIQLVDQNLNVHSLGDKISDEEAKKYAKKICEIFYDTIFNEDKIKNIESDENFAERYKNIKELEDECNSLMKFENNSIDVDIYLYKLIKPFSKILDIIEDDRNLKIYFQSKLYSTIYLNLLFPG